MEEKQETYERFLDELKNMKIIDAWKKEGVKVLDKLPKDWIIKENTATQPRRI